MAPDEKPGNPAESDDYEEFVSDSRPKLECRLAAVNAARPLIDRLERGARAGAAALVVGLGLVMGLQVLNRYVLQMPIGWTEEVALFCLVWLTFLGASVAVRHHTHFCVSILSDCLSGVPRVLLSLVVYACMGILISVFIFYGVQYAWGGLFTVSSALEIPKVWFYSSIPIGCLLMAVFLIERFLIEAFPADPAGGETA